MATRTLPMPPVRLRVRPQFRALVERAGDAVRQVWARARSTSRVARARVGYAAGVATSAWGVGVLFGLGWALLAGGLVMSVSFLLLYPVDEGG